MHLLHLLAFNCEVGSVAKSMYVAIDSYFSLVYQLAGCIKPKSSDAHAQELNINSSHECVNISPAFVYVVACVHSYASMA